MKIVICGSMSASKKMVQTKSALEKMGHRVVLPKHAEQFASEQWKMKSQEESAESKLKDDLIRYHYELIENADAVLIVNEDKNGIKDYIGGNVFLEMGFAHILNKKIFLLNSIPEISYKSEIVVIQPIVLNGDLNNIELAN
jgi:nucleoside 2-deoxyribosyltransferase